MDLEQIKYPIGRFEKPENISEEQFEQHLSIIENFPELLKKEVEHLNDEQLDTQYRPDGWTLRQVVGHIADSHMNSLVRIKLALTEDIPTIKPYMENLWAELPDSKTMPVKTALMIIEGIHARWSCIFRSLTKDHLLRTFFHPQSGREVNLKELTALYAWHSKHHLAHITTLKNKMGWE